MKQTAKRSEGKNVLPFAAAAVAAAALLVTLLTTRQPAKTEPSASGAAAPSPGSDLLIQAADIGEEASFFDYDAEGGHRSGAGGARP